MANKIDFGANTQVERSNSTEAFFSKYQKQILIAVVAVVLVIAGLLLYKAYVQAPREDKASTAMAKGQDYFNQEQFDKALNGDGAGYAGFVKIASDYSGTDAANLANLYAGLSYANLGKWNDALTYLEKFSTKSDAMVSPAAVSTLSKADDVNNSLSPTFLVQAGILLESQNKKDEALKLYQDIKKKYVNSTVVQSSEIDKYIERVSE
mgnify:CR=1 FL=1